MVVALMAGAIGCGSPSSSSGSDMARDGSAVCVADMPSGARAATVCGPMTCPAGMICLIFTPGIAPQDAADNGYSYSCANVPASCACNSGCGPTPSRTGCFDELCQGEPSCSFDGATLTCWGI